jgi:CheY-like chemotaxis protein
MLAREQRVELVLPRPDAALRLVADRPRVLRALGLLLQHALARSAPGARVEIEARAAGDADAPRVVILIRDFGPGLSAAQHLWLFESFAPEAAATAGAPTVADAGLRLSLARSLLQSMHGQVEALDGVQGGTELRVELPGAAAEPEAPPALDLLCVEDNPVNLQLVRELIALRPSMRLRTAVDGASGIAEACASPPDVMLLDLQLPDLHGIEVMRRLRAEIPAARTTFVALSADAMPDHVRAALEAGFDAYWTKPIDFGHFLAELDRMAAAAGRCAGNVRDADAGAAT